MTAPKLKLTEDEAEQEVLFRARVRALALAKNGGATHAGGTFRNSTQLAVPGFRSFISRVMPEFHCCAMHDLMIEKLEAVDRSEIRRLLFNLPPRHGKSLVASTMFPAWYLGRHAQRQIIVTSYNAEFAQQTISRNTQAVLRTDTWPYPHVQIDRGARSLRAWRTTTGGFYVAAGIGGPLTGRGAHLAVLDDVVKNREEADSELIREKHWAWYISTLRTRLMPGAAIVMCATRWHDDDLPGRLLEAMDRGGEPWEVVRLPAVAEENDPLGRVVGEALCPHRYPLEELDAIRTSDPEEGGERNWAALYQQRPVPAEGNTFKLDWMGCRYDEAPDELAKQCYRVASLDGSFKEGVANDPSAIQVWGHKAQRFHALFAWKGRVEYPDLMKRLKEICAAWNVNMVLIEDAASGQVVIQQLKREGKLRVMKVPARGTKQARVESATPLWEMGKVWLPRQAPWLPDFIDEHLRFPAGKHDDHVDASTHALRFLSRGYGNMDRSRRLTVAVRG